jgi:TrmH family RNA methyltransferase
MPRGEINIDVKSVQGASCFARATQVAAVLRFTAKGRFVRLIDMSPIANPHSRQSQKIAAAEITSRDNHWLKKFRSVLAGDREGGESIGVEGIRMVESALGSGLAMEAILVSESGEKYLSKLAVRLAERIDKKCTVLVTTDRLFAGIAATQAPQGIAALLSPPVWTMQDLLRGTPLIVMLAGVQDPGNVGTILRAAEAFGASGAIVSSAGNLGTADPLNSKALRASAGSALRLPILRDAAHTLLAQLRSSNVKVCATVPDLSGQSRKNPENGEKGILQRALKPWEVDWKSPIALLIGNEGAGLPDRMIRDADFSVTIPQVPAKTPAGIESLNAAMAATALLYEAMRQRRAAAPASVVTDKRL